MTLTIFESLKLEADAMDLAQSHKQLATAKKSAQENTAFETSRRKQLTREGIADIGSRVLGAIDAEGHADSKYRENLYAGKDFAHANADGLYELAKNYEDEVINRVPVHVEEHLPETIPVDIR